MTFYDHDEVTAWLERVHGDAPGLLSIGYIPNDNSGRYFAATVDTRDQAADLISRWEQSQPKGIYLRPTTLAARPEGGKRGGGELSHALPGVWADIDLDTIGHKHDPSAHDPATPLGNPLPPDETAGRLIVAESGLPPPTLWVHSGGGLYPLWLLDEPAILTDDTRPGAAQLSELWQDALQRSAQRLGYYYATGVKDLARVLRVPGTVNRKAGAERPCRLLEDTGAAYTLRELGEAVARVQPAASPPAPSRPPARPPSHATLGLSGRSAFDLMDEHVDFDDILLGAGWKRHNAGHSAVIDRCWTRPGDPEHPCSAHTLTANPHSLVVLSDAAGLPEGGGQRNTRSRVFARLYHGGDERAAALDIFAAVNGQPCTTAAAALPLPKAASRSPRESVGLVPPPPDDRRRDDDGPSPEESTSTEPAARLDSTVTGEASPLEFRTIAQLRADVAARGPRRYLLRRVWPAGDYGVHAAEKKGQKTWNGCDLAVSVASGTPWLGFIPVDTQGPVLMFVGEGGDGNALRRLDAVAEERGLNADDLPIEVCTRVPHLNNAWHLDLFASKVEQMRPALVTLDPLYLAARGAELGDLYKMGALLERPQHICQDAGASLFVITHFNRQQGKGASRITGAGPAEWGRVLISATVKARHTDHETQASRVLTELDIIGGEIPDQTLLLNRHVQAEDPDDLDSPLHIQTSATWKEDDSPALPGDAPAAEQLPPAARKLLEAIDATSRPTASGELVDWIAERHGHGLRRETVSRTLNDLEDRGLVDHVDDPTGSGRFPTKLWFRPPCDPRDITRDDHTASDRVIPRDRTYNGHGITSHGHGHTDTPTPQGHAVTDDLEAS